MAMLLCGCAKSAFPPGGPVDTTAPSIMLTVPADSSLRVPADQGIEILFSEPMDHNSVRDGIRVYPPPGAQMYDWSGRRVRVTWAQPLRPGTTYQAFLSSGARDAHGVTLGRSLTIRFSTGDSLDHGVITGVLRAKTLPTRGVPILAYPESLGLVPDFANVDPAYATETDTSAVYALVGLPMGEGFTIHALYDVNRSGSFDTGLDLVASFPDVIRLTPERAVADSINLVAVDPRAPALVSGTIFSPDSTLRFRVEARADSDTTTVRSVARTGPGDYLLRLAPGRYRLRAIRLSVETNAPPTAEIRREDVLEARAEGEYEHLDFRFERAGTPATPPLPKPSPEPEE